MGDVVAPPAGGVGAGFAGVAGRTGSAFFSHPLASNSTPAATPPSTDAFRILLISFPFVSGDRAALDRPCLRSPSIIQ